MQYYYEHLLTEFVLPVHNPVLIFLIILFVILLSPIIFGKFKIPGIVGLIIAGIVIGPHGINLLEKTSAIEMLSTIGLLYIMFIAGLDLDLNEFKSHRKKSILFGLFTFCIPILIGYPICYFVLQYDFSASLLTASMFATHTLVAYPIVSKLGISKNQAVAVTVGGTILTDTAVLLLLAIILGNIKGNLSIEFWVRMAVSFLIFLVIMFLIIPKISKWFFQKMESEKHAQYIFVLSIVFFAAFLSEIAGLEPIIGAFIAGLALNRLVPNSSPLMNRIEFIGNSLFIPFFLVSVGMLVDLHVVFGGSGVWIVASILIFFAMLGKWIAATLVRYIFSFSKAQGQLIFGLSSSHAAATLAVILVGYKSGIIDENILNATILLILVSCLTASIITERAGKVILENSDTEKNDLNFQQASSEHILVPVVNILNLEKLLEFAILIRGRKSHNPITMLSVVPNNEEAEANIVESHKRLEKFVHQAAATEVTINVIAAIDHNPASGISRTSRELMMNIIIIGWPRKTGIIEKITGDKVNSIVNIVDKNLFICRIEKPLVTHKKICVFVPPFAEKEIGFLTWVEKLANLSHELHIPLNIYFNKSSKEILRNTFRGQQTRLTIHFQEFMDWEKLDTFQDIIKRDDLVVIVSSRKGSVSYMSIMEKITFKLEARFENNIIVIYPQRGYDKL
ncbi:MAG: cation:proton antiporter [Spirochaetia bacterium]|nr:cation:proton antiporter [Spirochaetia bacterium]